MTVHSIAALRKNNSSARSRGARADRPSPPAGEQTPACRIRFYCATCGVLLNPGDTFVWHSHPELDRRSGQEVIDAAHQWLSSRRQRLRERYHRWRDERKELVVPRPKGAVYWRIPRGGEGLV